MNIGPRNGSLRPIINTALLCRKFASGLTRPNWDRSLTDTRKMIDISQWRESIGLWNYCQATSGRPTSRCFVGGDRAGSDSESTNRKKKCRRSLVLSIIVFLLFVSILLSGYLNYEPHLKGTLICHTALCTCVLHV